MDNLGAPISAADDIFLLDFICPKILPAAYSMDLNFNGGPNWNNNYPDDRIARV